MHDGRGQAGFLVLARHDLVQAIVDEQAGPVLDPVIVQRGDVAVLQIGEFEPDHQILHRCHSAAIAGWSKPISFW